MAIGSTPSPPPPPPPPPPADATPEEDLFELVSTTGDERSTVFYVAPDSPEADADYHKNHFNTLVIRPELRLELRLGSIDLLFARASSDNSTTLDTVDTKGPFAGRKARLQVAGMFCRPLDHRQSPDCYTVSWDHFRKKKHLINAPTGADANPIPDGDEADLALIDFMTKQVVQNGKLPKDDEFARMRFPGGHTFSSIFTTHPNYEAKYSLGADRYPAETDEYDANPVLGKLPLVARVKRKNSRGKWVAEQGVKVYFQLVEPDTPLANDTDRTALRSTTMLTRPAATAAAAAAPPPPPPPAPPAAPWPASQAGPDEYIKKRRETYNIVADDPQGFNAHKNFGGKRTMQAGGKNAVHGKENVTTGAGTAVERNNLFLTESFKGFNVKHATRPLGHKDYPVAEGVEPDDQGNYKHCVRATTNEDGETGVIFEPSRVAGDRYKIRVFIGPPTLQSNGTEGGAVKVETGTLVVWRTVRMSRNLEHRSPGVGALSPTITTEFAAFGITPATIVTNGQATGNLGTINLETIKTDFKKAYCEFIVEHEAGTATNLATIPAEWQAAFTAAANAATADAVGNGHNFDVNALFYHDIASPYTFNIHTPTVYNANRAAGKWRLTMAPGSATVAQNQDCQWIAALINDFFMKEFMKSLAKGGLLPGITVVRGLEGCTWDALGMQPNFPDGSGGTNTVAYCTSGVATDVRGCFVWYGIDVYNSWGIYGLTSNTMHEMGHCYYREHAPGGGSGGAQAAYHDPHDICVMSYASSEGEYCGQCVGALMGFDTRATQFQGQPPPPPPPAAPPAAPAAPGATPPGGGGTP